MVKTDADFWQMVRVGAPGECWNWLGRTHGGRPGHRYGTWFDGRWQHYAHRFALSTRVRIKSGEHALHRCDNTLCCNPDHLYAGTPSDNMRDIITRGRGRWARGEAHGLAKLTPEKVLAIYNDERTLEAISKAYGVGMTAVGNIKRGETWSHVTGAAKREKGTTRKRRAA